MDQELLLRQKKTFLYLNITPLVDVVFLLLLFFMLTAHFIIYPGIKITLPQAETANIERTQEILIFISQQGEVYLGDKKVMIDNLFSILSNEIDIKKINHITIKADNQIPLDLAVRVMDIARKAGASGITISTKKGGSN
ncbi:MAG: biopolymer transporter ExbD [Candidatus Hydrogenedentota bacterium]